MHQRILASTLNCSDAPPAALFRVNIPSHFAFLAPDAAAWANTLPRLPALHWADERPPPALVSERVMPVPRQTRRLLVHAFRDRPEGVLDNKWNEHCLVRPYLGRRRRRGGDGAARKGTSKNSLVGSGLRDYPLHADQMEQLGLPAAQYALAMADALAFLHWTVRTDAAGVEFVLARPRHHAGLCIGTQEFDAGSVLGPHAMWLLDFDCCGEMPMTEEGVGEVARGFWMGDPFFPHPDCKGCDGDERLWRAFRDRYLCASREMVRGEDERVRMLPEMVVARIVETVGVYKRREGWTCDK
ncbi:zinc finger protein-domain-containing protein [Parachaetomium inaequale]|uniref:Zinc finger protein-domain-containing protein n=1 Tax=Parachaetomium inaequale TaxID=2588326 RepID=A0AAN6PKT2_9PEZI|nr:zinc finger protein-domain-containing protein [Parachaetomium inaequale]